MTGRAIEGAAPSEVPAAVARLGEIARPVAFNAFVVSVAAVLLLHAAFIGNFTALSSDVLRYDDRDLLRYEPNLVNRPFQPHTLAGMNVEYGTITLSTNSLGFRDYEHARQKPKGVYRVAVMGDSFVFGLSLAQDAVLPRRIERALNGDGAQGRFEVMNFGIPGLNTDGMSRYTEAFAVGFDPDLVLYSFIADDVSRTDNVTHASWMRWLSQSSWVPQWALQASNTLGVAFKMARQQVDFHLMSAIPWMYQARLRRMLGNVARIARHHGHEVGLIVFDKREAIRDAAAAVLEETGVRFHLVDRFEPELNRSNKHPTRESNVRTAAETARLIQRLATPHP